MAVDKILVVDDEETLCEVLKINLENEGYDVDIAFSAEQALGYNLTEYSLILLDIMMGSPFRRMWATTPSPWSARRWRHSAARRTAPISTHSWKLL